MEWRLFDNGSSPGQTGSENGIILRDEEHPRGARITLERGSYAPYAITCGVYGWLVHTCFFATQEETERAFVEIKNGLENILTLLPDVDAPVGNILVATISAQIHEFVKRFG